MGSTDSPKAEATVPSQVFPYVQSNLKAASQLKAPQISANQSDYALQALGNQQLGTGGAIPTANALYTNTLAGKYLDPMSNPSSQGMLNALNTNYTRGLGQGLDQLNSQFGLAGQPMSSGPNQNYAARYANTALTDYQNSLSNMLGGMYNTERGYQNQALFNPNPILQSGQQANTLANTVERGIPLQQYNLNAMPIQLMSQALQSTPMGHNQYGQSEFSQNFGMGTQAATAAMLAYLVFSSRRWKTNIRQLEGGLDKVMKMRGVRFDWKKTGRRDIGLIAEEVGEILPEVVVFEADGKTARMIDYSRIVTVLIEAVKEQQAQIEALKEKATCKC